MAKVYVPMFFDQATADREYVSDRGVNFTARGGFYAPPDMTDDQATTIVTAAGARGTGDTPPCPENADFTMRKLRFIRYGQGQQNSITVPIGRRANVIDAGNTIRGILNQINNAYPVVCVQLIGEEWDNIYEELRTSTDAIAPGDSSRPATNNAQQFVYTNAYTYDIDNGNGNQQRILNYRVNTNNQNQLPSLVSGVWATCNPGNRITSQIVCVGRQPIEHRRYILTSLVRQQSGVDDDDNPETEDVGQITEVPVSEKTEAIILSCGQGLANLASSICIAYKGETNKRFDKLLS